MEEERRSQKGFVLGLIFIGVGIAHIAVGILITV
jgi:hypothetical protein